MKRKFLIFLLPLLSLSFIFPFDRLSNEIVRYSAKSDNPNNHYMINYENGDNVYSTSNVIYADVIEDESGQYISSSRGYIDLVLNDSYTFDQFSNEDLEMYFTLYDTTNSTFDPIETIPANKGDEYWLAKVNADATESAEVVQVGIGNIKFNSEVEEFHEYRIGFNVQEGDDMVVYSGIVSPAVPTLVTFQSSSSDDSITINYEFANPSETVDFDYNEIYLKVDNRKIDLNEEVNGEVEVNRLKPAQKYSVTIGYDATKIVSEDIQYNISKEEHIIVSTKVPASYGTQAIALGLILLIILLIIFLLLLIVILYWNHQRRKIKGMALVIGEDTEVYDPVYQHNYHQQEDEVGIPNATSNQGDEVYGYFDEVELVQETELSNFDNDDIDDSLNREIEYKEEDGWF